MPFKYPLYRKFIMNFAKYNDEDYINFLIASQKSFKCTEAARCDPADDQHRPAHDSVNRMLERLPQSTEALWEEAKPLVNFNAGVLILDTAMTSSMRIRLST